MNIDLDDLVRNQIIDTATAERIRAYQLSIGSGPSGHRLSQMVVLAGIILIGLGLLLIIRYQWHMISVFYQTLLACIPLVLAQGYGAYLILKKEHSIFQDELAALSILWALGIATSLVWHIYTLDWNLHFFLQTWIQLAFPLIFLFRSGLTSLFIWIGLAWYITTSNHFDRNLHYVYSALFLGIATSRYIMANRQEDSRLVWLWHQVLVPIVWILFAFSIAPGTCERSFLVIILVLFFLFQTWADSPLAAHWRGTRFFEYFAFIGFWTIGFLYAFSSIWTTGRYTPERACFSPAAIGTMTVFGGLALFLIRYKSPGFYQTLKTKKMYWFFAILLSLGLAGFGWEPAWAKFVAHSVICIGVAWMIHQAISTDDLIRLNAGLLLLGAWLMALFFQSSIPLIWRGIAFLVLGIICFVLNYYLVRQRKP
jgi:hypothetical protein